MKKLITLVLLAVSLCLATPATTEAAPRLVNKNGAKISSVTIKSKGKTTIKIKGGKIKSVSVKNKKVCTVKYTKYSKKKKNSGTSFTITAKKNTSSKTKKTTLTVKCTNGKKLKLTVGVKGTTKPKKNSDSSEDVIYAEMKKIKLNKKSYHFAPHAEVKPIQLKVIGADNASEIYWESTDPECVTVDKNDLVKFVGDENTGAYIEAEVYYDWKNEYGSNCESVTLECLIEREGCEWDCHEVVVKEATCGTPGIMEWECEHGYRELNDDGTHVQITLDPTEDHKMSPWKITKYPTAEEGTNGLTAKREDYGTAYSVCENCGGNRVDVVVAKIGVGATQFGSCGTITYGKDHETVKYETPYPQICSGPHKVYKENGVEYILVFGQFKDDYSKKMEDDWDAYRAESGLDPMNHSLTAFQDFTRLRAVESSVIWSHGRPNGKNSMSYGENLHGSAGPDNAIESWKTSEGHNKALTADIGMYNTPLAGSIAAFEALYVEGGKIVHSYGSTVMVGSPFNNEAILSYSWR